MRRILLAFMVSLAVHLLLVAVAVGFGVWQSLSLIPPVKMQTIAIDVVKDLPLGAPPAKEPETSDEPPARARKSRPRATTARDGVTVPSSPDAGAPESKADAAATSRAHDGGGSVDGGRRRPGDLRQNGPEGSRMIALLRLDRLRASPDKDKTIAAVDQLLLLLPDRHRLIDGTGFDLYLDFDGLLIATPDPRDDAVTFLAARHHLTDAALKAGLDRGAKTARRPIEWQTIGGRPVGLRQRTAGGGTFDRDDRILALPQASLAVMATPAYATQLLDIDPRARPGSAGPVDAGDADARAGGEPQRTPAGRAHWRTLVARIDAEDAALPDDATFMMMATGLFASSGGNAGLAMPSARGASDDTPLQPVANEAAPPQTVTLVVGLEAPFIDVTAEFKTAAEASQWERELPAWRRKLLTNPIVLLSGFSSLIGRAETHREGANLYLRAETSTEELQRLLNLTANLTRAAQTKPR